VSGRGELRESRGLGRKTWQSVGDILNDESGKCRIAHSHHYIIHQNQLFEPLRIDAMLRLITNADQQWIRQQGVCQ